MKCIFIMLCIEDFVMHHYASLLQIRSAVVIFSSEYDLRIDLQSRNQSKKSKLLLYKPLLLFYYHKAGNFQKVKFSKIAI